jgi:hypothetical protein
MGDRKFFLFLVHTVRSLRLEFLGLRETELLVVTEGVPS